MQYDGYHKYDAQVAKNYDQDRRSEEHWQLEQLFIEKMTAGVRLGRVLDIPVGTGRFLQYYQGADEVVGLDISSHMLQQAAERLTPGATPQVQLAIGDALALQYEDAWFDTVVCFRLAHLLPPSVLPKLFAELARVTKDRILLQVYASQPAKRSNAFRTIRSLFGRLVAFCRPSAQKPWTHIQSYAHQQQLFFDLAASAKLKLVAVHDLGRYEGSAVQVLELSKQ